MYRDGPVEALVVCKNSYERGKYPLVFFSVWGVQTCEQTQVHCDHDAGSWFRIMGPMPLLLAAPYAASSIQRRSTKEVYYNKGVLDKMHLPNSNSEISSLYLQIFPGVHSSIANCRNRFCPTRKPPLHERVPSDFDGDLKRFNANYAGTPVVGRAHTSLPFLIFKHPAYTVYSSGSNMRGW